MGNRLKELFRQTAGTGLNLFSMHSKKFVYFSCNLRMKIVLGNVLLNIYKYHLDNSKMTFFCNFIQIYFEWVIAERKAVPEVAFFEGEGKSLYFVTGETGEKIIYIFIKPNRISTNEVTYLVIIRGNRLPNFFSLVCNSVHKTETKII